MNSDPHGHSKWCTGEVDTLLEEMINVVYAHAEDQSATWLAKDSENLAPYQTMQKIQEEVNDEIERLKKGITAEADEESDTPNFESYNKIDKYSDSDSEQYDKY